MSILYDPTKILKKVAPPSRIKRLLNKRLTLKRAALAFVDSFDFIDKKAVTRVALKTVQGYQERVAKEIVEGGLKASAGKKIKDSITKSPKQLLQRVGNEIVFQIKEEIKAKYSGEKYEWLPSDADEPDPEHQLKYGRIYTVGEGEMPGDRYGCKCGMRILVNETELELE